MGEAARIQCADEVNEIEEMLGISKLLIERTLELLAQLAHAKESAQRAGNSAGYRKLCQLGARQYDAGEAVVLGSARALATDEGRPVKDRSPSRRLRSALYGDSVLAAGERLEAYRDYARDRDRD